MRALRIVAGIVAVVLVVGCSIASAESEPTRVPIRLIATCGDFLRTHDDAKPEIVYWLATRGDGGNSGPLIGVEATDRMVPVLVERCKAAPAAPFAKTVRAQAEKPLEETPGTYRDR